MVLKGWKGNEPQRKRGLPTWYHQAIYRYGLELEEGAAMTGIVETIYEDDDIKLKSVDDGFVVLELWKGERKISIKTDIWEKMVLAWVKKRVGKSGWATFFERLPASAGEVWCVSKDTLAAFLEEAERLSFIPFSTAKVVKLRKVKQLLFNLASGRAPDTPFPPPWAGKDVVGYLIQRGWAITEDGEGLQRRGFFIPADKIETAGPGGSESTADVLECEASQRTDREDKREEDPHKRRHQVLASRPANGCSECRHLYNGSCAVEAKDVKQWVAAGDLPGAPQVVPGWCPLERSPR
jgi:hypothetical protein